jgi:putative tryptophan/tyrosine transport system substrate-binding protein
VPASIPALEAPDVTKNGPFASRQRPQARESLVRATVYLRPDKLALIKQTCADTNRRISDVISEAVDDFDQYRRAAGYVDRILKGEKPADLPVQAPTKYELVINLKTAKALGLEVPPDTSCVRQRGGRVMKRRELIMLIGGTVAWPLVARAQQGERIRRIGFLMPFGEHDPEMTLRMGAFRKEFDRLGWSEGRNVRFDYRWAAGVERFPTYASELVGLAPAVILVQSNPGVAALQKAARSIPIVFASVADPVGSGFIRSLSHPGGNITGFTHFEPPMGEKWLEALKKIAPGVTRVAALLHMETAVHAAFLRSAEAVAPSLGLDVRASNVHDAAEIERAITAFAAEPNGGLIVMPHPVTVSNRDLIISLAARHRLPAVYAFRFFAAAGGLMSYGADQVDMFRRAASYVDRILRGAKPDELPVQVSNHFELVLNVKTAKTLGLEIPPTLLAIANEVIE